MKTTMMKKSRPLALLLVLTLLATFACSCASTVKDGDTTLAPEAAATPQLNYVSLRINPEIELITDENDLVVSANAINEDGELVLIEMEPVENKTVEEVAEDFAETSTELGFVDVESEDTTVYVDASAEDEEDSARLKEKVAKRIHQFFDNHGIYGKVSEETLEKYAAEAAEWDLPRGHVKMMMRLLDLYPEMTAEEALKLSVKEIREMIHEVAKKHEDRVSPKMQEALNTAIEALKTEYAEMFELRSTIDGLRTQLDSDALTDELRATLEAELEAANKLYVAELAAYKAAILALKEQYKEESKAKLEESKAAAEEKRAHHAEKWQQHKNAFEADREGKQQMIRDWREKEEHVLRPSPETEAEPAA